MNNSKVVNGHLVDNQKYIWPERGLNLIQSFFDEHFLNFVKINEYDSKTGYWGISYSDDFTLIEIQSDRGGLACDLEINGEVTSLNQVDVRFNGVCTTSENNILIMLSLLEEIIN